MPSSLPLPWLPPPSSPGCVFALAPVAHLRFILRCRSEQRSGRRAQYAAVRPTRPGPPVSDTGRRDARVGVGLRLEALPAFSEARPAPFVAPASSLQNAQAYTYAELQGLTYLQVKGSGLANTCPVIDAPNTDGKVKAGSYKVDKMCLEPTSFTVKEDSQFKGGESEFVKTKLMTRLTYSLDAISGEIKVGGDGSVEFKETDGIDYAPVTVQLPGGERVPFLFSIKNFAAKGNTSAFGGEFSVPSYRGSSFLDPKVRAMHLTLLSAHRAQPQSRRASDLGAASAWILPVLSLWRYPADVRLSVGTSQGRGASTGYDNAVALPARADAEELLKENVKNIKALKGTAVFSIAKCVPCTHPAATGRIASPYPLCRGAPGRPAALRRACRLGHGASGGRSELWARRSCRAAASTGHSCTYIFGGIWNASLHLQRLWAPATAFRRPRSPPHWRAVPSR